MSLDFTTTFVPFVATLIATLAVTGGVLLAVWLNRHYLQ
jgi:hypothetical protein